MGTIQFHPRKKENSPICLERHLKPGFLPCSGDQHSFFVGSKLVTVEKLSVFRVQQKDVGAARWAQLLESPQTAAEGRLTATAEGMGSVSSAPRWCTRLPAGASVKPPHGCCSRKSTGSSGPEVLATEPSTQQACDHWWLLVFTRVFLSGLRGADRLPSSSNPDVF